MGFENAKTQRGKKNEKPVFLGFGDFTVMAFVECVNESSQKKKFNVLLRTAQGETYVNESMRYNLNRAINGKNAFSSLLRDRCNGCPGEIVRMLVKSLKDGTVLCGAAVDMVDKFRASLNAAPRDHWALAYADRVAAACESLRAEYDDEKEEDQRIQAAAWIVFYLTVFFINNGERPEGTPADAHLSDFIESRKRKAAALADQLCGSTFPINPAYYLPREDELETLRKLMDAHKRVVLIAMGGVGKTALMLEYVRRCADEYDHVLYAVCSRSNPKLADAIADDSIRVGGLVRGDKSALEYAKEKLAVIGRQGSRTLLVIDNYDRLLEKDELYKLLANVNCAQLITSRVNQDGRGMYFKHRLPAITDPQMLRQIAEGILRDKGQEMEWDAHLEAITRYVHGNLKALEVLLGQMCASYLTPQEFCARLEEAGIRRLELTEGVDESGNNAAQILPLLFDISADVISEEMKQILYDLSMVPLTGIGIRAYKEMAGLGSFEPLNRLIDSSWVERNEGMVHLHPIVAEAVMMQVMKEPRDFLTQSRFLNAIGRTADRNWTISAKEREMISPIVRNVLYEQPEIEESTVALLEKFCRLAFDDRDRSSAAIDTLIRIEAYWRERDANRHLYVSYLIVEYVPGVLGGPQAMRDRGYDSPAEFDVTAFAERWYAHIRRLTQEGRYALAVQCRMIGVRHIRAEAGNAQGLQRLSDEFETIRALSEKVMRDEEDLSYLRAFPGLYGYNREFLCAAIRHFSSRMLFRLADCGYLGREAYDEAYALVKQAQTVLLCADAYADFAPWNVDMLHRVRADILCTEGHILLKQNRLREAAGVLRSGIEELDRFLVPMSRRYAAPYEDMVCAAAGLTDGGEVAAALKERARKYKEKLEEIKAGY